MQYALVNGQRSQPAKGLEGICSNCSCKVIAKCGNVKIHHWAHYRCNENDCDKWWESETEWHRNWKNKFPEKFREKVFKNIVTGECHRADIFTDSGIAIEFQHSRINSDEIKSREEFYKNLVWVIDASRSAVDVERFKKGIGYLYPINDKKNSFSILSKFIDRVFPKNWLNSSVPVVFDFQLAYKACSENDDLKDLYYLTPSSDWYFEVERLSIELFIERFISKV
jgi:competence protein CoiA